MIPDKPILKMLFVSMALLAAASILSHNTEITLSSLSYTSIFLDPMLRTCSQYTGEYDEIMTKMGVVISMNEKIMELTEVRAVTRNEIASSLDRLLAKKSILQ